MISQLNSFALWFLIDAFKKLAFSLFFFWGPLQFILSPRKQIDTKEKAIKLCYMSTDKHNDGCKIDHRLTIISSSHVYLHSSLFIIKPRFMALSSCLEM